MHPFSCPNTHHDVRDLVNHQLVKNTKNLNISRTEQNFPYKTRELLTCPSDDTF